MSLISARHTMSWLVAAALVSVVLAVAVSAGASYRMVILSDRTGGHQEGVYPSIIREINLLKPDIIITVGDQIEGYGDDMEAVSAEWDTVLAMLDELEAPVYLTAGNHDIWSDESEEIYRQRAGFDPYYSFDYSETHYVVLDNSRLESWSEIGDEQLTRLVHPTTRSSSSITNRSGCSAPHRGRPILSTSSSSSMGSTPSSPGIFITSSVVTTTASNTRASEAPAVTCTGRKWNPSLAVSSSSSAGSLSARTTSISP
ncbi:metallophosphoesterase [bacterium]|nr:metallophosphoesterase [bacterium]